jgi:hypothetical protein
VLIGAALFLSVAYVRYCSTHCEALHELERRRSLQPSGGRWVRRISSSPRGGTPRRVRRRARCGLPVPSFSNRKAFLQSSNLLSSPPPPHLHLTSVQQPKHSDQSICLHPSSSLLSPGKSNPSASRSKKRRRRQQPLSPVIGQALLARSPRLTSTHSSMPRPD